MFKLEYMNKKKYFKINNLFIDDFFTKFECSSIYIKFYLFTYFYAYKSNNISIEQIIKYFKIDYETFLDCFNFFEKYELVEIENKYDIENFKIIFKNIDDYYFFKTTNGIDIEDLKKAKNLNNPSNFENNGLHIETSIFQKYLSYINLNEKLFTEYFALANPSYMIIYIYIYHLLTLNNKINFNSIASKLNIDIDIIYESLLYWQEKNLIDILYLDEKVTENLNIYDENDLNIIFKDFDDIEKNKIEFIKRKFNENENENYLNFQYEFNKKENNDEDEISLLYFDIEQLILINLTKKDRRLIYYFYYELNMSYELILEAVKITLTKFEDKNSKKGFFEYVEGIINNWYYDNIRTLEEYNIKYKYYKNKNYQQDKKTSKNQNFKYKQNYNKSNYYKNNSYNKNSFKNVNSYFNIKEKNNLVYQNSYIKSCENIEKNITEPLIYENITEQNNLYENIDLKKDYKKASIEDMKEIKKSLDPYKCAEEKFLFDNDLELMNFVNFIFEKNLENNDLKD